jgi:hypothetical protein
VTIVGRRHVGQIKIDFEWRRDPKGYRLLDAETPRSRVDNPDLIMFPESLLSLAVASQQRVVRRGGALEFYRPLDDFESLYKTFAKTAKSPEGVLEFIEKFGPLTERGLEPTQGDDVSYVIEHANSMHALLSLHATGNKKDLVSQIGPIGIQLSRIDVALVGDRINESLKLHLGVRSLLGALWLQFGQALSSGARLRLCQQCGDLFETGPGTGRRLDAKFCSDEHRVAFNSLKRKQEK